MEKKLPSVFANKIDKSLDNNESIFYSSKIEEVDLKTNKDERTFVTSVKNVNQKINSIFTSPRYVYKADVDIKTKDGIISRRIVGRNSTHLITIDNELVSIADIIDIDFSSWKNEIFLVFKCIQQKYHLDI